LFPLHGHDLTLADFIKPPIHNSRLTKFFKFILRNSQLTKNLIEKRRADFAASVHRYGNGTPVGMAPFSTASLAKKNESEEPSDALKIARRGARQSIR
jgi:hypothetical protein